MSKTKEKVKEEVKVKYPSDFSVFMLNDNVTTMDFVVSILVSIFSKNKSEATQIMLNIHNLGKAKCGTYSYEIAEAKVEKTHLIAKQEGFPLTCIIKEEV